MKSAATTASRRELTAEETVAQLRRYADHLIAYADGYGPDENPSDPQRYTREQMYECGGILRAILNGEEWALRDF